MAFVDRQVPSRHVPEHRSEPPHTPEHWPSSVQAAPGASFGTQEYVAVSQ